MFKRLFNLLKTLKILNYNQKKTIIRKINKMNIQFLIKVNYLLI